MKGKTQTNLKISLPNSLSEIDIQFWTSGSAHLFITTVALNITLQSPFVGFELNTTTNNIFFKKEHLFILTNSIYLA